MAKLMAGLIVSAMLLTACNTTRGIGQDVKSVGKKIEDVAD